MKSMYVLQPFFDALRADAMNFAFSPFQYPTVQDVGAACSDVNAQDNIGNVNLNPRGSEIIIAPKKIRKANKYIPAEKVKLGMYVRLQDYFEPLEVISNNVEMAPDGMKVKNKIETKNIVTGELTTTTFNSYDTILLPPIEKVRYKVLDFGDRPNRYDNDFTGEKWIRVEFLDGMREVTFAASRRLPHGKKMGIDFEPDGTISDFQKTNSWAREFTELSVGDKITKLTIYDYENPHKPADVIPISCYEDIINAKKDMKVGQMVEFTVLSHYKILREWADLNISDKIFEEFSRLDEIVVLIWEDNEFVVNHHQPMNFDSFSKAIHME